MPPRKAIAAALVALSLPGVGNAQEAQPDAPAEEDAAAAARADPGFCRYVRGVAGAQSALLLAPEIFGTVGVVNVGEAEGTTPLGRPKGRVMLGLEYDLVELWKGLEVQNRAEAECRRYVAQMALDAAVRAGGDVGAAPALAARAEVLAAALPHAERLVESLRYEVQEARATIDELDVVRLRLDDLRREAREAALARQRVEVLPYGQGDSLVGVLDAYRAADAEVESIEGGLRNLDAWKLRLRGGYDEILDVEQERPFFGLVTLTFDLGGLWVPGANGRAAEGRRRWLEEDVMGADRRVSELIGQLHALRDAERARLDEVKLLAGDLAAQLDEVRKIESSRVRGYESFLFFELTRLRGEQAYLEAHLAEIDRIIGAVEL